MADLRPQDVERRLANLLEGWTGISPVARQSGGGAPSVVLVLGPHTLVAEFARDARAESLEAAMRQVLHVARKPDIPLVVVPYMTPTGAARCQAADVAWADLSGNAHIVARSPYNLYGDLVVHVAGQPNAFETRGRPRNAFAPKSARVTRLLLAAPAASWTQSDLAHASGIDAGHVSRIVARLLKAGLVARDQSDRVVVPEPGRLLDAWAESNAFRHRVVEGHLPGRAGEDRARRLADGLSRLGSDHAFTGLAAAWAYTHASGFRSVSCFVIGADIPHALDDIGFRTDTEAPNARLLYPDDLGVFEGARAVNALRCAAPAQVFVDLAREPERAEEFAAALRPVALAPPPP